MSGSFSSITTSLSALRHHPASMDVAGHNIADVGTEGLHRRRALAESVGAPATPAIWSRYDGVGGGVRSTGVERFADPLLGARSRTEHGTLSSLQVRAVSLSRLESGIAEPGDTGVAAAMALFRGAWQDLANSPGSPAARTRVLASAALVADAVAAQARNVDGEEATQRMHLLASVGEVNTAAAELAETNRALASARVGGLDTSDRADQRDRLGLRLADLAGGVATPRADGGLDVSVAGISLVSGVTAGRLEVTAGVGVGGEADGMPIGFAITSGTVAPAVSTVLLSPPGGRIGGTTELLITTLPGYAAGLDAVVVELADRVNAVHGGGYEPSGAPGRPFFSYDPADPAASLRVALSSGEQVAVSTIGGGALDSGVADVLAASGAEEAAYQEVVNGLGTQVASAQRLAATQGLLTSQVDSAREQLGGVSPDEEMVSMLTSQRAYEAAARVMTVVDSVLDTLLNRTGAGALMGEVRLTQDMPAERSTQSLQGSLQRLARTQEVLSTGTRINRLSDDPADSSSAMRLRVSVADQDRYLRSAQDGVARLDTMDSTLSAMADSVCRVTELAIQGANGTTSATAREALAAEVDELREGLIGQANTTYLGRPVFGGVTPGSRAFDDTGAYVGSTTGQVTRTVAEDVAVRVDLPGTDVVGADGDNLFGDLTALSAALRAGDQAGALVGIEAMQQRLIDLGHAHSTVGAVQRRMDLAIQQASDRGFALRTSLSEVEDADVARTMIDLKVNEVAYQAALGATARVMQPSLLDFLR